jgi:hypothetical protein
MRSDVQFFCRVCGLPQEDAPWGEDGRTPTYEICPCCGVEFGYEDARPESVRSYRAQWMGSGAQWFSPNDRPAVWELEEQLRNVPSEFR